MVQRYGALVVLKMARDALRAEPGIDSGGRSVVAIVAGGNCVGANERKSVTVLLNRRNSHLPAAHRVAALAIGSELPSMQVGVTFRAGRRRTREYQAGVTTLAGDCPVQALQFETRLPVMIKLRLPSNRFPCSVGVAVFTTNFELPVRVGGTAANRILRDHGSAQKDRTRQPGQEPEIPRRRKI